MIRVFPNQKHYDSRGPELPTPQEIQSTPKTKQTAIPTGKLLKFTMADWLSNIWRSVATIPITTVTNGTTRESRGDLKERVQERPLVNLETAIERLEGDPQAGPTLSR